MVGLATHVIAASVWLGGLLALGVHVRSTDLLAEALPRYSRVALACFTLVAVSGVVMGWVALTEPRELLTTPYGQLLLGKTAALGTLGVLGHLHRQRTLPAAAAWRPRAFRRLAAVELVVMVATAALAVGLSRTAPPDGGDHAAAIATTVVRGIGNVSPRRPDVRPAYRPEVPRRRPRRCGVRLPRLSPTASGPGTTLPRQTSDPPATDVRLARGRKARAPTALTRTGFGGGAGVTEAISPLRHARQGQSKPTPAHRKPVRRRWQGEL